MAAPRKKQVRRGRQPGIATMGQDQAKGEAPAPEETPAPEEQSLEGVSEEEAKNVINVVRRQHIAMRIADAILKNPELQQWIGNPIVNPGRPINECESIGEALAKASYRIASDFDSSLNELMEADMAPKESEAE